MTEIVPWLNTVAMPVPARAGLRGPGKRGLQLALGVLWLADAGLQFQPYMFSRQFITETIEPAAAGDPGIIARPIMWAAQVAGGHLALANAGFALIQLLIAAGLFYPEDRQDRARDLDCLVGLRLVARRRLRRAAYRGQSADRAAGSGDLVRAGRLAGLACAAGPARRRAAAVVR